MFKIILAPNAFKESLTAKQAICSMKKAIEKVLPKTQIISYCLSDGGDGFLEAVANQNPNQIQKMEILCYNAIGESIKAPYLILNSKTVIIETAQVVGLQGVPEYKRDSLNSSSYGIGQIIKHALDQKIQNFIIGLGGTATTDGGTGIAQSLGIKFFKKNQELTSKNSPLPYFDSIDTQQLDPRLKDCHFKIICDVTNPLLGINGTVQIFSPQKGTNFKQQKILEKQMIQWEKLSLGNGNFQGSGAGGGLGFFFQTYTQSQILSGSKWILENSDIRETISEADLVITTEGKLDSQSSQGKLINKLAYECSKSKTPLVALVGGLEDGWKKLQKKGLTAAFCISPHPASLTESMKKTDLWLEQSTEQICHLFFNRSM